MNELLGYWNHFSVAKMHDFDVFNECVTNQPTDQPTDFKVSAIFKPHIDCAIATGFSLRSRSAHKARNARLLV